MPSPGSAPSDECVRLESWSVRVFDAPYVEREAPGPVNIQVKLARQAAGGPFEPPQILLINRAAAALASGARRVVKSDAARGCSQRNLWRETKTFMSRHPSSMPKRFDGPWHIERIPGLRTAKSRSTGSAVTGPTLSSLWRSWNMSKTIRASCTG